MGTRMGNMCAKMAKIAKRWQNILKEGVHEIFDFAFSHKLLGLYCTNN